ncbi:TPA: glycosyltransferase family 2 protein [Streptococcus suis]
MNGKNGNKWMINFNNKKRPKFSVIVPVYNVKATLKRCMDSILNQTYDDFEVILINDGSTDNSLDICNEYQEKDKRIQVFSKANGGLSSARNMGIDKSSGEYLCFVDSDDWISVDMLAHFEKLISRYQADIVSATYKLVHNPTKNDSLSDYYDVKTMKREEALEYFLYEGMHNRVSEYPVWNKCYRKELFTEVTFPIGVLYEDYVTNIKLIKASNLFVKSTKVCYYYYQGGSSIIRSGFKYRDNDVITQSELAEKLVSDLSSKSKLLARQKTLRTFFSLLLKIAVYGFDSSVNSKDRKEIVTMYTKELRNHLLLLLSSPMPLNRKTLLLILCIDYRLLVPLRLGVRK